MGWNGSKSGSKVGFWAQKWVKNGWKPTFAPTLNPFRDFHENPLFTQLKGAGNCFLKTALRQSRPSISIDSKYLRKMVLSWHRHWHFHAKEGCYSSSNSTANSWKTFARHPKIGSRNGPKFWNLGPEKIPRFFCEMCPKFRKLHLLWFEWPKSFQVW